MGRSLTATAEGKAKAERALTNNRWSREDLASQVIIDNTQAITVQTVHKFFSCRPVDRKYFAGICKALDLDWSEISEASQDQNPKPAPDDLDTSSENCDRSQCRKAIKSARERIWVCQTWFPGMEIDAVQLCESSATDIRIVLLSFKEFSPIYARLQGRKMEIPRAKHFSASSVESFARSGKTDCIRFNYGHHPGWITVADSLVFWGPTPVDKDSHSVEFLFRKHAANSEEGIFWIDQFEVIWNEHSHDFDEESRYNEQLFKAIN